jgi:ABC-type antimicrobial peptide transport system ATPase subunit
VFKFWEDRSNRSYCGKNIESADKKENYTHIHKTTGKKILGESFRWQGDKNTDLRYLNTKL